MPLDYKPFYERHASSLSAARRDVVRHVPVGRLDPGRDPCESWRPRPIVSKRWLRNVKDPLDRQAQAYLEQRRLFGEWDEALHCSRSGPTWLRERTIAELLCDSMHQRDGAVYDLIAYCIMPNHVHLVFVPLANARWRIPLTVFDHALAEALHGAASQPAAGTGGAVLAA